MNIKLKSIIRFLEKIDDTKNSCWIWTSTKSKKGYGYFTLNRKLIRAHRLSYELFKGDIPKGLQLDHLCRNRGCVNPEHLEPVTQSVNSKRGLTGLINNPQTNKTHCKNGHKFDEENLTEYTRKFGHRRCKICNREYQKVYQRNLRKSQKMEGV